jgi:inner membrane transporter RhtA
LPGATGSAAAAALSGLAYVPIGVVVLLHHPPTFAAASYALVAGVLSSAVPFFVDLLTLRRVPAQFFGVFMSVNPVLAALVGLVVLDQQLAIVDWAAILVIVSANAVAITFGGRKSGVPEVDSNDDAVDHNPVPVGGCDVLHGVPELAVTPAFGKVSADGEPRTSRLTQ